MTGGLRNHFVYRVYDKYGLLLYIGCTMQPITRWYQHRNNLSDWVGYAHSFKMSGPYGREVAFRLEKQAIGDEAPFFNRAFPGRRLRRTSVRAPYLLARETAEMAWALGGAA